MHEDTSKIGPEISKGEMIHVIMTQKNGKAISPDKIYAEVHKLTAEKKSKNLTHLVFLFNKIYNIGQILIG